VYVNFCCWFDVVQYNNVEIITKLVILGLNVNMYVQGRGNTLGQISIQRKRKFDLVINVRIVFHVCIVLIVVIMYRCQSSGFNLMEFVDEIYKRHVQSPQYIFKKTLNCNQG